MAHINYGGRMIEQGEGFETEPGYRLVYVRDEGARIVLRDASGEFTRPVAHHTEPAENNPLKLAERRTVVEATPDHRSLARESVYMVTHQMSVPGGWQDICHASCRAPENLAGIYAADGLDITDQALRLHALELSEDATAVLDNHPYTRLAAVLTEVRLRTGTGTAGGWDDPGTSVEIAELLEAAATL